MRKRFWMLFLSLLLLSGCGRGGAEAADALPPETEVPESTAAAEPADRADYVVVLEDRSLKNENGGKLVESVYEKLVLQGDAPEIAAINDFIAKDCDRFFEESGATAYYEPEILEQMIRDMGLNCGDLLHNAYVTVTHNQDCLLSVCVSVDWFMGGVFNEDYYGMTFDLRTGEFLPLERLSDLPGEELEAGLKEIAARTLRESWGETLLDDPEIILEQYTLAEMLFYVREGEIMLTFPTYTFAAGAAGAVVIPTGIFVKTAK